MRVSVSLEQHLTALYELPVLLGSHSYFTSTFFWHYFYCYEFLTILHHHLKWTDFSFGRKNTVQVNLFEPSKYLMNYWNTNEKPPHFSGEVLIRYLKKKVTKRVVRHWNLLSREILSHFLCKYSRGAWTWLLGIWFRGDGGGSGLMVGLDLKASSSLDACGILWYVRKCFIVYRIIIETHIL